MKFTYNVNYPERKITAIGITTNGLVYTGVAKCAPEDAFNVRKGKKLARLRAQRKQLRAIQKVRDEEIEWMLKDLDRAMGKAARLTEQINKIEDQIQGEKE